MQTLIKRILPALLLLLIAAPLLAQQTGGQFWVQAFEDRNGNGQRDPGEPFLTRGVSVDLLNAQGVVMASGTLDNAPFASQGFIGFLYLAPGNYTAVVTSPDLTPTTSSKIAVTITAGATPITVPFGAQKAADTSADAAAPASLLNSPLARVALSGFGAIVVVGIMAFLGLLIYMLVLRSRAPRDIRRTTTTGTMRTVRVDQTGEIKKS